MYYLLLNGAQAGPFTLAELIGQWRAGRIGALTLYWEQGNADWLPLHNIAPLLEMPADRAPTDTKATPLILPTLPTAETNSAATEEEVLWTQHPTLWHWTISIFWGIVLTPVLIGILILVYVGFSRRSTVYQVTNRRVSVQNGIFTRSSRELRIADIRSIAARANIFGIGDVEFSTAARADAEVVFWGLSRVEGVRDLVKKLQNDLR